MKKLIVCFLFLIPTIAVKSQDVKFNKILYGVAYYQEYMPYERLEKDVQMMEDAGINVVRMGESTWSLFEPQDGVFEFAWLDRVVDRMQKAGIKVIIGTPTYSIPAWMAKKHPEILSVRLDGSVNSYGIRQNTDLTNPTYLFYCERIIRKVAEHYAKHPAVIGFQVDNETSTYGAANLDMQRDFVDYLKNKYKTVDSLNRTWGLKYWGMTLADWDEFPTRQGTRNPCYKLEWDRFVMKVPADFIKWQASIVNEYKRKDQFVTHDFMPWLTSIDQFSASKSLDIMSLNIYHDTQDKVKGEDVMLADDVYRSLKKTNFLITETNAQATGWDAKGQYPPFDGQPRLFVYSHLASGANMVEYWHWHSIHYGQETYWKGVLGHDLEPNRFYNEVSKIAHELKEIGPKLVNLKIKNKVAILYSRDADVGNGYLPIKEGSVYSDVMHQMHRAAFRQNIGVDFVFADDPDFAGYQLLLVPPLYIASDALLKKISDFVKQGGHVIMSVKSGFCDENSVVRHEKAPGPLREAAGFYYQEFSSVNDMSLTNDPFKVGAEKNKVSNWVEFIIPEKAKALASYDDPFFGKFPAITENKFGKGSLIYEGCLVSDEIQSAIVIKKVQEIGLVSKENRFQYPVVNKSGTNDQGKTIHYYLNYSDKSVNVIYNFNSGTNLFAKKTINNGENINLNPWDVAIVEE